MKVQALEDKGKERPGGWRGGLGGERLHDPEGEQVVL